MEDYDSAGNIRSSMPVQFLGTVWTPCLNCRSGRPGSIAQMPELFPNDHQNDHEDEYEYDYPPVTTEMTTQTAGLTTTAGTTTTRNTEESR